MLGYSLVLENDYVRVDQKRGPSHMRVLDVD